jgi:NADPH:quinone reductase-like Zn-dependent oxidoreductase
MSGFYNEEELKELGLKSFGKNVLVFPCGSEIGLEIVKSLRKTIHFKIFGASSVDDHGRFVCKNYIENVPYVEDENFIKKINEIVKKHKIDFIFPAHDSVVLNWLKIKIILMPRLSHPPLSLVKLHVPKEKHMKH